MAQLIQQTQIRIKKTTAGFLTLLTKILSGLSVSLVLALIGQEIFSYGTLSMVFIIVAGTGVFLRLAKRWTMVNVLIFDLICILVGLLLRMYIVFAPGS